MQKDWNIKGQRFAACPDVKRFVLLRPVGLKVNYKIKYGIKTFLYLLLRCDLKLFT